MRIRLHFSEAFCSRSLSFPRIAAKSKRGSSFFRVRLSRIQSWKGWKLFSSKKKKNTKWKITKLRNIYRKKPRMIKVESDHFFFFAIAALSVLCWRPYSNEVTVACDRCKSHGVIVIISKLFIYYSLLSSSKITLVFPGITFIKNFFEYNWDEKFLFFFFFYHSH